ncbi:MAG TPA: diguanylate cyclase [Steroidobacteraceae bacterium]|nr:diguanylate cyclase [Steroidobacteraceae bacterium]
MNERPDTGDVTAAARAVALLNKQADEIRADIVRSRLELEQLQRESGDTWAAQLVQANEQLVLAALQAETIAETATGHLDELARASQRDALTDTPNRALMLDRLENAIALARRHVTRLAVLFLDLDQFKHINDTMGHAVGDEVLQLVARRLESVVRASDTVSRHGGDEFLVLIGEVSKASDAAVIAAKILAVLTAPCRVGDHMLRLSASLGIATYPDDGEDAASLISRADAAMYRSKRRRRGGFEFHREQIPGVPALGQSSSDAPQLPTARYDSALSEQQPRLRELREANEQLVIAALTAQQMEAQAELAYSRQTKFLAMVAHELRNPLIPIQTAAGLLNRALTDEPLLAQLQAAIKRQVSLVSRLVDDLLDGSRVSSGKFRLECSVVEMAGILSLAVETCRPAVEARSQSLTIHLAPAPLLVIGDPLRLGQIFSNLLDNASKYTAKGGEVSLMAVVLDRTLQVTVSDNGIGIMSEALPNIFELFMQDARAVAHYNGGLGIGLAVVRDLVEAHGGTVTARSPGRDLGSDFIVTLPMSARPIAAITR